MGARLEAQGTNNRGMRMIPMTQFRLKPARVTRRGLSVAAIVSAGALAAGALGAAPAGASAHIGGYRQINLVSDQAGKANLHDADLVNAWGLAASPGTNASPGSPLWVADNGSDVATLYAGASATSVSKVPLTVNVTGAAPTGQVFNGDGSAFMVKDDKGNSGSALFIFDTENGTIDGWAPNVGGPAPSTVTEVARNNGANAVYKGLAEATVKGKSFLYATNFRSGRVEAYDSTFTPVEMPGGLFVDPGLPAGYGPFGIAEIKGKLYVTFAKQDATLHDDVAGPGHGFVDVFTNTGAFVRRLVTRGALNSPWGLALAPRSFGRFGGDLLVGNFGNGLINVYNPDNGASLGRLRRPNGLPVQIDGLWGLMFGNGNAAKTGELVFSAGPADESHGLLGKIVVAG
jgi:uncharacterized protein (TIGR03118 family)